MQSRQMVWIGMLTGSFIGAYIPALWDAGVFSLSSIILSAVGAIIGIWLGFRLSQ